MNLLERIRQWVRPALAAVASDPARVEDLLSSVRVAGKPEHGDYQINAALPLSKQLGRPSRQVAEELVRLLPAHPAWEPPQIAGPGFINLRLRNEFLAAALREAACDSRLGVPRVEQPRRYVIDYSSPNVAKPLHVGHLRSTILGDALTRLLRFLGHTVITDNHLGDWGTQFGILIYGYKHFVDPQAYTADPVRELARLYVHVRSLFRSSNDEDDEEGGSDDPIREACRRETAKLHAGDPENLALWRQFMPHCLEMIERIYRRLDILPFDYQLGESFYHPMLAGIVEEMLARGLAQESAGAVVIPNPAGRIPQTAEELQRDDPPGILRKRDGAFTYLTTDLATIRYRMEHFQPAAILYVVDARQALHFRTLFAQARRWGYDQVELQHISFGTVLGEDRRPFAARKGGAPELEELLAEAVRQGRRKYEQSRAERQAQGHKVPELSEAEIAAIAEAVGIGAVKYADLSQNRTSDYVFSYDRMLATDGNTATYMQYAYARCRSIFREGNVSDARFRQPPAVAVQIVHPSERTLALHLLRFAETLQAAASEYLPHYITNYLWDLAKAFSVFFEHCPVLKAESADLRDSRLLLVDLAARTIRQALELLGIRTVERM
ncbi:MAG: arginine--tRNA ligase [Gemmataceae bacterium]|nr:arginine--tRNA ligase [Gemmataceae bacterium]